MKDAIEKVITIQETIIKQKLHHEQALDQATDQHNEAIIQVANAAQEVSDNATPLNNGYSMVANEDMKALKEALKEWSKASHNLLRVL